MSRPLHGIPPSSPKKKEATGDELAGKFARANVRQVNKYKPFDEPLDPEVEYERRKLLNPKVKSFGILYDGFELQALLSRLVPEAELSLNHCHLIFTNHEKKNGLFRACFCFGFSPSVQAPSIGRLRCRILDELGTADWTRGGCRRLDGFWVKMGLAVGFLGSGVWIVGLELWVVRFGFWYLGWLSVFRFKDSMYFS